MIGVRASITLGELRSIRVFVLGDVERPGLVHRQRTLDDHECALRERRRQADRLAAQYRAASRRRDRGDARPLRPAAARRYARRRAAAARRRDLRAAHRRDRDGRRARFADLRSTRSRTRSRSPSSIALAGGLNAAANRTAVKLERVVPNRGTTVQDIDLAGSGAQTAVRDGDVLRVPREPRAARELRAVGGQRVPAGSLSMAPGHAAHRPAAGLRARQAAVGPELRADSARDCAERRDRGRVRGLAGRMATAQRRRQRAAAAPRHRVRVSSRDGPAGRSSRRSSRSSRHRRRRNEPLPVVRVGGQVRAPGEYPLEPGMRISDLLRAGGGLSEAAYATDAELTRYTVVNGEYRETELVTVNLASVVRGDAAANLAVGPVRLSEHQRGVALARRGVGDDPRRGGVPRHAIRFGEARSCRRCSRAPVG